SHARAAIATDNGEFTKELAPVAGLTVDEGIRRDTSLDALAGLRTPFRTDGVVTAGTASQISDGAAALAVTTSEWAAAHGLAPLARIHTAVVAGDDPILMLTAPIPATAKALRRSGLSMDDIGVYEVNEAFAPVPLAWLAETGADPARLNPRGGAIALGHPLGASGARLMTTMLHHMRDNNIRYGLQTMCEGGGMANATILELV
ncbi:MAG: acetyl-CoA acyltransferase, partial [Micromonosporaceae bacterium]|nr:acetyl-CoA acyltransferase [Micromonosporaceae bacterium]